MAKRKITAGDWLRGAGKSIRQGSGSNVFATQRLVNSEHDARVARLGTIATEGAFEKAYPEAKAQRGRDVQFDSGGIKVRVKNGFSRNYNEYTTDIILIDPRRRNGHHHIVLGADGREIHNAWTNNHN